MAAVFVEGFDYGEVSGPMPVAVPYDIKSLHGSFKPPKRWALLDEDGTVLVSADIPNGTTRLCIEREQDGSVYISKEVP